MLLGKRFSIPFRLHWVLCWIVGKHFSITDDIICWNGKRADSIVSGISAKCRLHEPRQKLLLAENDKHSIGIGEFTRKPWACQSRQLTRLREKKSWSRDSFFYFSAKSFFSFTLAIMYFQFPGLLDSCKVQFLRLFLFMFAELSNGDW